ncbi:hypothetical protein D0Y65_031374, partial [Glycine soja]
MPYYFHQFWVLELLWASTMHISSLLLGGFRFLMLITQYESPHKGNNFIVSTDMMTCHDVYHEPCVCQSIPLSCSIFFLRNKYHEVYM